MCAMIQTPAAPPANQSDISGRQLTPDPSIGLVLGGGGARGLAHILALEVFDEIGVRPSVIAGCSIGAIIGAAYASGLSALQIRRHAEAALVNRTEFARSLMAARNEPLQKIWSVFQLRSALFNAEALLDLVLPSRVARDFADLEIPLHVVAVDYHAQCDVAFNSGDLRRAVAASMALPALFAPVTINGRVHLDGGFANPLPFDTIKGLADITVAIDVSGAGLNRDETAPPSAREALVASSQIFQAALVNEKLKSQQPDILIHADVGRFGALEFYKLPAVLEAAAPAKAELRARLERILSATTLRHTTAAAQIAGPSDDAAS